MLEQIEKVTKPEEGNIFDDKIRSEIEKVENKVQNSKMDVINKEDLVEEQIDHPENTSFKNAKHYPHSEAISDMNHDIDVANSHIEDIAVITPKSKSPMKDIKDMSAKKDNGIKSPIKESIKKPATKKKWKDRKTSKTNDDSNSDKELPHSERYKKGENNTKNKMTESVFMKSKYKEWTEQECKYVVVENQKNESFGLNGRYSKRNRYPVLNELLGERLKYGFKKIGEDNVPQIIGVYASRNQTLSRVYEKDDEEGDSSYDEKGESSNNETSPSTKKKKPPKKVLMKNKAKADDSVDVKEASKVGKDNGQTLKNVYRKIEEESTTTKSVFVIPKLSQKPPAKNFDSITECEILETDGQCLFVCGKIFRENLRKGDTFNLKPKEDYYIKNFSQDKDLKISIRLTK